MFGDRYFAIRQRFTDVVTRVRDLGGECEIDVEALVDDGDFLKELRRPFLVCFCGETNSGKSTLINGLFGEKLCEVSDRPNTQKHDLPIALVDSRDTFDPASYGNDNCRHLIWLRCSKTEQALKCSDLLLSDGNLPLIILDLHLVSERELRQIPTAFWHRLKIQARDSGAALVSITPRALLPTPHRRFTLGGHFTLDHLELTTPNLQLNQSKSRQIAGKA